MFGLSFMCFSSCGEPEPKSSTEEEPCEEPKINLRIYIENSASMDGYVANKSVNFKHAINGFINSLLLDESLVGTLNTYYINSSVIPYQGDVDSYIKNVSVEDFVRRGGSRATTNFTAVMKSILDSMAEDDVSILVSDLILSPGRGADANEYLLEQQQGLQKIVGSYSKKYSVVVYRLLSEFDGRYYDPVDEWTNIKMDRPFFVILIGKEENLIKVRRHEKDFEVSNTGYNGIENAYNIVKSVIIDDIQLTGCIVSNSIIKNGLGCTLKKDIKGEIFFDVHLNLSTLIDDRYLFDTSNYEVSDDNYRIEYIKIDEANNNFTHKIRICANRLKPADLTIKLKRNVPSWVFELNDDDGYHIADAYDKTYGLKYILTGISEAYGKNDDLYSFTINLKTK